MERGTIIQVRVIDTGGLVEVTLHASSYRARLLDCAELVIPGQNLRLQLDLDPETGESSIPGLSIVVVATVCAPAHTNEIEYAIAPMQTFTAEVQRLTRGMVWSVGDNIDLKGTTVRDNVVLAIGRQGSAQARVLSLKGDVELSHAGNTWRGLLVQIPKFVELGQELHLRLSVQYDTSLDSHAEYIDLIAHIVRINDGTRTVLKTAFRADLGIGVVVTRQSSSGLVLPQAHATDSPSLAQLQHRPKRDEHDGAKALPATEQSIEFVQEDNDVTQVNFSIDANEAEPSGMQGNLQQMTLIDVVQALELNRKTARIDLPETGQKDSCVYIDSGHVVAAFATGIEGEAAFYQLANLEHGTFSVHFGCLSEVRNVHASTTFLILEYMRQLDESGRVQLPTDETESTDASAEEQSPIHPFELAMHELVDQQNAELAPIENDLTKVGDKISNPANSGTEARNNSKPELSGVFASFFDEMGGSQKNSRETPAPIILNENNNDH